MQNNKKEFKTLINETTEAKVLFTWGRFNPPTTGHEKLITKLSSEASSRGADFKIFPTKSEDPKKNPLSFRDKVKFMKKAFPSFKNNISSNTKVRTIIDALKDLSSQGYKEVTIVVGSDRVREFKALADKYNNKQYSFDKVNVISAGKRDPDSTGTAGMSASKLRALALDGNKKEFMSGLPSKMPKKSRLDMFKAVRKGMQIEQLNDEFDKRIFLNEGFVSTAGTVASAGMAYKYLKNRNKKKEPLSLNKKLNSVLGKKDTDVHYDSIGGSKFIRLLRLGLVQTKNISMTQQAFLNMQKSASAPPYRNLIFNVTQRTIDMMLNDEILYRRFLVLLHRQTMFEDNQLSGLIKKSKKSGVGLDLILEVYLRGVLDWDESEQQIDPNQYAFNRVNSFLSGGAAERLDSDLVEQIPSKAKPVKSKVKFVEPPDRAGDWGTSKPANKYLKTTPGQPNSMDEIEEIEYGKQLNIDNEFSEFLIKE